MIKLNSEILESMDFYPQTKEDLEIDTPIASYKGFTIGLCIPNGGIVGVSFWCHESGRMFASPTELLSGFPGYGAKTEHIALAQAAIDAATIETGQLSLMEAIEP